MVANTAPTFSDSNDYPAAARYEPAVAAPCYVPGEAKLTPAQDAVVADRLARKKRSQAISAAAVKAQNDENDRHLDLLTAAKTILNNALTSREAGFKIVALLKANGYDAQQAFRYAREFVVANFWKRPDIKPIKFNDGHYSNGLYKITASNWSAQQHRSRGDARRFLNRNKA